ncbi:MAG: holo-ACP synthase [Epsilonproteobacteria bacterium]|nr:holo-ACP synthase [Campylobacterota bacterium]
MIGIDIVVISRIERMIERFGTRAKDKFMTPNEQAWAVKSSSIAGIWAAKEAFSKAMGVGISKDFSFMDIEILKTSRGAPTIHILNPNLHFDADVSITHDGGFAIAVVVIRRVDD